VPSLKAVLTSFTLNNPGIGETVRRTRGAVFMQSDQTGAVEQQFAAYGAIVVSDVALALGSTAIPGPVVDASDDGWFVWGAMLAGQNINVNRMSNTNTLFTFDSKAMRKVPDGFGVAIMVENTGASGFSIQVAIEISMLTSIS